MAAAPKVLHVGTLTPISDLDPHDAHDFTGHLVLSQVFESPMRRGAHGFEPVLLDGPLRSRTIGTKRVYTARIRDDARFSDGSRVRPEHIVDAIRHATREEMMRASVSGDAIEIEPADPEIRPEEVLAHRSCLVARESGERAMGTGPFMITAMSEECVRLTRNPHASRSAGVDAIEVRCHRPADGGRPEALLDGLTSGSIDFTTALSRDDVSGLSGVRKVFQAGVSTAILSMNTERPHFADLETRRAVSLAIDRYRIAELCYANPGAFVARCLLPPGLGRGNDRLRHDPVEAQEIMAGRQLPSALKMVQVWGPRPYLAKPRAVAETIAGQLAPFGVRLDIQPARDSSEYRQMISGGDYDLVLGGWVADTPDAIDYLDSTVSSAQIPSPDRSPSTTCNYSRWQDETVDRLLMDARRGSVARHAIEQILERVADQVPLIPLMYGPRVFVHSWRVKGFEPDDGAMPDLAALTLDD